jgi:predicted ATP-dependent protease
MTEKVDDKIDKDKCDKCVINRSSEIKMNEKMNDENFECREMNVLIKHLENNWTIKKNANYIGKNEKEKEYILKKNTGRDVKMKLIRLKKYLKEEDVDGECKTRHKTNTNIKLSDSCLRNFIYNALENEWKLKKTGNKYFCSKRHKGDKRVYEAGYLKEFLLDNFAF